MSGLGRCREIEGEQELKDLLCAFATAGNGSPQLHDLFSDEVCPEGSIETESYALLSAFDAFMQCTCLFEYSHYLAVSASAMADELSAIRSFAMLCARCSKIVLQHCTEVGKMQWSR